MDKEIIIVKVNTFVPRIIFLGLFSIAIWAMVFILLIGMFERPSEIDSLWFFWIVMVVIGLLSANHVIWETIGKVEIEFDSKNVNVRNVNNLLKKKVHFSNEDLRGISFNKEKVSVPSSFWGFAQGDILIKYKNGSRRLGKGLRKQEALKIVELLSEKTKIHLNKN